jgi:RNA polymerase sigma-70 factor (ECF subfamily)
MHEALAARGRAVWPGIEVSDGQLAGHLARLELPAEPHADLYLACACAVGDPAALAAFDTSVLSQVGSFVSRIDASPPFADEVRQALRERLLVARGPLPPRIAEYSGRGALGAWVRVAAVRVAIDLHRDPPDTARLSAAPAIARELSPDLQLLKARHQSDYEDALRGAFLTLDAKERNLLRMHFVDGLTVDRIGLIYQVHRATAARWVQAVREKLLHEVYRCLGSRLRLSPTELDSLTALVQSQLQISLTSLFLPSKP